MKKALIILFSIVSFLCISFSFFHFINRDIISSEPNMSEWTLSNDDFIIVPTVNKTVTFRIEDKDKRTVYVCEKEWRAWDFKYLGIDTDSNITITTADMGDEYYYFNGETWVQDDDT